MLRDDAYGLFWEDIPPISTRGTAGDRPLPPIPETGWQMPDDYPSLEGQGAIALDVEGYDPDLKTMGPGALRDGYICGVSIGTEAGFRRYYPVAHQMGPNLDKEKVFRWLKRELKRPVPKIGANLLYDLMYLTEAGIEVTGPFYDVQVAEPLIDENKLSYSLENIAKDWLGEGKKQNAMREWLVEAFGETNYKGNIYRAPASVVGPYGEGDVDLPLRVFALQRAELQRQNLWDLFLLESSLIPMLLAMWRRGVNIDLDKAGQIYENLATRQTAVLQQIKRVSGIEVDIWSADSLAEVFDSAGIPYLYTEKTGKPSFRKDWLQACPAPVAQLIVDARRLDKFKGTFIQGYLLDGHINGCVHCQFHQLRSEGGGTVSGRFSSSDPNLQNIPIRDEELGNLIRSCFIAEHGKRWWKFDWSQIEFRLAIHHAARLKLYGAQQVVDQYWNDPTTDYHKVVAEITGQPRKIAKNINFGIIYGLGVDALAINLGVDVDTAYRMYRDYLRRVPFVGQLRNRAMDHAARTGVITTLKGRNRHFDVWEKNGYYFQEYVKGAKRAFTHKALNARLQGDAADIMKTAMSQSWEAGVFDYIGAPHLTVHDELDGSDDNSKASNEALAELKHIMETCVELLVPLKADGGTGPNWGAIE
jgi:DNA polymerase I-like protein with 3'-5' exonuclease and polymerase domains